MSLRIVNLLAGTAGTSGGGSGGGGSLPVIVVNSYVAVTKTISGRAPSGASVTVTVDGVSAGMPVTANSNGDWSFVFATAPPLGAKIDASVVVSSSFIIGGAIDLFQIASNRFAFPTDWGNNGNNYAAVASTEVQGQNGGNPSAGGAQLNGRWNFSTFRFFVGTETRDATWLWNNAVGQVYGVYEGKFSFTIQKAQVRRVSDKALIDTIKWAGSGSKEIGPGEDIWNDLLTTTLLPGVEYEMGLFTDVPAWAAFPCAPPIYLKGEIAVASLTVNYADPSGWPGSLVPDVTGWPTIAAGTTSSALGGRFAPSRMAGKGSNGAPVGYYFGDSILDTTHLSAKLLAKLNYRNGDYSFVGLPLGKRNINYAIHARYSQNMNSLLDDGVFGSSAKGVIDYAVACDKMLQPKEPLCTFFINQHLRNNMGTTATLAAMQTLIKRVIEKIQGHYPGVPVVQLTCDPSTTGPVNAASGGSYYACAAGTTQTPAGAANSAGGTIQLINELIERNGGGKIDGTQTDFPTFIGVDVSSPLRDPADYGKWIIDPFEATLLDAVTANATNIIRLDVAPPVGLSLVFDQGTVNTELGSKNFTVHDVEPHPSGGFKVTGTAGARNSNADAPLTSIAENGRLQKAHAAGSTVRGLSAQDLSTLANQPSAYVHASHKYQLLKADKFAEKLDIIIAAANDYAKTIMPIPVPGGSNSLLGKDNAELLGADGALLYGKVQ